MKQGDKMLLTVVPHLLLKHFLQFFTGTEKKTAKRKVKTKVNKEIQVCHISQDLVSNVAKHQGRALSAPQPQETHHYFSNRSLALFWQNHFSLYKPEGFFSEQFQFLPVEDTHFPPHILLLH